MSQVHASKDVSVIETIIDDAVKRVGWRTVVDVFLGKVLNIAIANGATPSEMATAFDELCRRVDERLEARKRGN